MGVKIFCYLGFVNYNLVVRFFFYCLLEVVIVEFFVIVVGLKFGYFFGLNNFGLVNINGLRMWLIVVEFCLC